MLVDVETYDEDESYYHEKRNQVYKAPEFLNKSTSDATACGDVYAFSIILIEIATRNDPYGVSHYLLGYYISQKLSLFILSSVEKYNNTFFCREYNSHSRRVKVAR